MAGQITKRGENTWYIRIFLGRDADDKRRYFNKTIHGTKKDANKFLTAKLREKDLGVFVEPASETLNKYLDRWLVEIAKPRLRENTYKSYVWIAEKYIKKHIGLIRLSDLQAYQIQKFYGAMQKQGLSARTVRYAHTVLSSALKQAVKWRMINQNPCDLCELPRKEKKEMKHLSADDTIKFLQAAKDDKFFTLFLLIIETGMRPSEYFGLQWKDIDFDGQFLSVRRAVHTLGNGSYRFAETKTKKSRRSIPFSNSLLLSLKKHRNRQLQERLKLGASYQNLDLVFASEVGTPIQHENFVRRHFKPILKNAELPDIRLYDLRHTTASLLLSAGENPKVVSERLGHASIVITLDTYSHVLPTMQKEATEKLERMLYGT
ncbi:MAG: tyrosine-type recombinase/integrase [Aridibacter sp.]